MFIIIMIFLAVFLLTILSWLRLSHQYRWRDGYDSDLENDYQSMLKYNQRK